MAMTRAQRNRKLRNDNLRNELKSREYLRQIHIILDKLDGVETDLQMKAMQLKLNSYFKLLSKTLPDVKAVELNAVIEEAPKSRADLEHALNALGLDPKSIAMGSATEH